MKRTFFKSSLEAHPEIVKAVGMLTIEMANLESQLCNLLSKLLSLPYHQTTAIYFSPKTSAARLDIIENVLATIILKTKLAEKVPELLKRARSRFDKRNNIIHAWWTVDLDTKKVFRIMRPKHDEIPIELTELQQAINATRVLIEDIDDFCDLLWDGEPPPSARTPE